MEKLNVGKIVNTQGLKGDVRIYPNKVDKEIFEELEYVFVEGLGEEKFFIEKIRYKKNLVIAKFKGFDHINDIEKYRERDVFIIKDDLVLEDGEYHIDDLIGCTMIDEVKGEVGKVVHIMKNKAHETFLVETEEGVEFMVPYVDEFIKEIDMDEKKIYVKLIEGLI